MDLHGIPLFLETSHESADLRFQKILGSCFAKSQMAAAAVAAPLMSHYWNASAFGLDRVTIFKTLGASEKDSVLRRAGEDLMRESCFIEMAGLSYTARMSLESKTLDERVFYSMMASEEATHFQLLRPFVGEDVLARGPDEFTALIGEMITSADREHVIFLIQVLLEGWGLSHFSWMATNCQSAALRDIFKIILKDEARHHAAGTALAKSSIAPGDKKVVAWLEMILGSVSAGPVRLITALEETAGVSGSRSQILLELDAVSATREKLHRLRGLLENNVDSKVLAAFAEKRLFEPSF